MKLQNKLIAELIGTFWLVFGGCGTALFGGVGYLGVAIAFGLTVLTMAYAIGHVSGAHLNPAVSLGVYVNGRMSLKDMFAYWAAQFVGASVAAALLYAIGSQVSGWTPGVFAANGYGDAFKAATGNASYLSVGAVGAFITECVLTFIFLLVILGATDSRANNKFAGIAIGLCLTLIHLISIPLTNTSVNPARSFSQCLFADCSDWCAWSQLPIFIIAPLVGAALAGLVYNVYSPKK